jgi:phosphopentomutase
MLENFQASFDAQSGNYIVNLKFIARTSAMLDDVRLGFLYALPHMYLKNTIPNTESNNNNTSSKATASNKQNGDNVTNNLTVQTNSRGYSKIKEVFDLYKQKGLIDQNVPVTTINEMSIILQKYTQFLNQEFDKLDFTNIVDCETHLKF